MHDELCRREREAQDVRYRGVDEGRRLGAEEAAHDEAGLAAGFRCGLGCLSPSRRGERERECQGLGHFFTALYALRRRKESSESQFTLPTLSLCFIGVPGSWMPIVSSVASGQLSKRAKSRNPSLACRKMGKKKKNAVENPF